MIKNIFSAFSIIMLLSSIYSFTKAGVQSDDVKRLLYANLGLSQLIVGTLVIPKLSKDVEDL